MNEAVYYEWKEMVEFVARMICRQSPDSEVEDITQTLWEGLIKAQRKGKLMSPEEKYARSSLFFLGRTQAEIDRKNALIISPQYHYRTADVRLLLETFFDRENWYEATYPEDAESELGHPALECSADIARGWKRLRRPDQVVIFKRFALNEPVDSAKLTRACQRLADEINRYERRRFDGPGTRRVLSNAQAASRVAI